MNVNFINGNNLTYPGDVWLSNEEIPVAITPMNYNNLRNQGQRNFLNQVQIQPSADFNKMKDGRYFKYGDERMVDPNRFIAMSYDAPPLQINELTKDGGNGIGEHADYTTLDTGHNRYYTDNDSMSVYPERDYTMQGDMVRVLRKYPDGTVRPWYYRRLDKEPFKKYDQDTTSQFLKDSTYFREGLTESLMRDINAQTYEFNYFY